MAEPVGPLIAFSDHVAVLVERVSASIVAVHGGGRWSSSGIHWRPGKHEHNLTDWTALLDFADAQFSPGKPPAQNFDERQFPDQAKAYSWKAP